jgi:hypothetical protein
MIEDRLCTPHELGEWCRTGTELIHDAIASGDPSTVRDVYTRVVETRIVMVELWPAWMATTFEFLKERHGDAAVTPAIDPEAWAIYALRIGIGIEEAELAASIFSRSWVERDQMEALVASGDSGAATTYWAELENAMLKLHDYRHDMLTSVWAHVYRTYGADGLNEMHLFAGEKEGWQRWVREAIKPDPVDRVREFAFLLAVGNFGAVSVTETDDYFLLHHKLCGSCARQELNGRYEEPWNFPRVTEDKPELNLGDTRMTVYRTHIPPLHWVVPIKAVGHPWPVIECGGPGRCWYRIYKDQAQTPVEFYERVGMTK